MIEIRIKIEQQGEDITARTEYGPPNEYTKDELTTMKAFVKGIQEVQLQLMRKSGNGTLIQKDFTKPPTEG